MLGSGDWSASGDVVSSYHPDEGAVRSGDGERAETVGLEPLLEFRFGEVRADRLRPGFQDGSDRIAIPERLER